MTIELIKIETPVCWLWPAPVACAFKDDDSARQFLRWWHNGTCAMCGSRGDLVCDHDHRTALERGYLCRSCNCLEGHAGGEGRFAMYRARNPASILGIRVRYYSPFTGYAEPEPVLSAQAEAADQRAIRDVVDRLSLPSPEELTPRHAEPPELP